MEVREAPGQLSVQQVEVVKTRSVYSRFQIHEIQFSQMDTKRAISQLEQMVATMTNQLVDEKVSWETCRSSAETGLRLVKKMNGETEEPSQQKILEDLHEKFAGILNYRPGEDEESDEENLQYLRYHMILTLDSVKKLKDYLTAESK